MKIKPKMNRAIKIAVLVCLLLGYLPIFGQGYKNPVNPGSYPDPSICRVGDDYYMVNSSFEYFPGVPIFHSKDLINWEQIGHVLTRESQLPLEGVEPNKGIYAPTLRYHDGIFYMITTYMKYSEICENFYVTATNPAGPWSDPINVKQSGIDPSLFWDDDGKVYFQSNRSLSFNETPAIYQSEIDLKTGKLVSDTKMLWKGSGALYVEGPHVYKKDGYYYLMTAEGGTYYNHQVAISRSKSIWGPYESCPHNPILCSRDSYDVIQGTGHADLIQAHDGSWWMVFLCIRPTHYNCFILGRETGLAPVEWVDGWPVVNKTGVAVENMNVSTLPLKPFPKKETRTDFNEDKLGLEWNYIRNPVTENYLLNARKGYLALKGTKNIIDDSVGEITFVGRRIQHWYYMAETKMEFDPASDNDVAGLTIISSNEYHYDFFIKKKGKQNFLVLEYRLGKIKHVEAEIPLNSNSVRLKVEGKKEFYEFSYAVNNADKYTSVALVDSKYMSADMYTGYTGPYVGLFASGNGTHSKSMAYFDYFNYRPEKN